jgi:hypothetical protein
MTGGGGNALDQPLRDYNIGTQPSRVVFQSRLAQGDRRQPTPQILLEEWPQQHAVSKAVSGLQAIVVRAVPIDLPDDPPEGVQAWPLATTPESTWAEDEFMRPDQASRDESDPSGPFTVAAAVEAEGNRLVVLGDRY